MNGEDGTSDLSMELDESAVVTSIVTQQSEETCPILSPESLILLSPFASAAFYSTNLIIAHGVLHLAGNSRDSPC